MPMTAQKFKSLPICVHSMRHKKNRFKNFNHKNNIIMQCRKISRNKENPYSLNMADVTCVAVVCRVTACNLCWLQVSPLVRAGNTPQGKNTPHTRNTPQGDPCCPHKTPLWCVEDNCKCETKELERRCTRGLAREETCEPGSKVEDGAGDVTAGDCKPVFGNSEE